MHVDSFSDEPDVPTTPSDRQVERMSPSRDNNSWTDKETRDRDRALLVATRASSNLLVHQRTETDGATYHKAGRGPRKSKRKEKSKRKRKSK
jgi:hypothetical protein